ncbi:MAG: threonine synthase, partial [Coriobacteriales bacterium]|nr:threonine synthase [Coriobacteriales bacterium]
MSEKQGFINTYMDTRGLAPEALTFTQTIVAGIAEGGGLFVPRVMPRLALDEVVELGRLPYAAAAASVYRRFGVDLPSPVIDELMRQAYGKNFDSPEIAPVVEVAPGSFVLELWHGPTSAFKDMALQCLPVFFSAAIEQLRDGASVPLLTQSGTLAPSPTVPPSLAQNDFLILVATSGDTGKAALEGFRDRAHTNIIVFYPHGGVSDIQLRQ